MKLYNQNRIISIAICLALALSMTFTSNVFADDITNLPPTEAETSLPPVEEPTSDETNPPIQAESASEGSNTVSELLSQLPDTNLVVTIDNQVVPLVTTEATNAILKGDPIWCPDGASPNPLVGGCTDSYSDLESLINDFNNSVLPEPSQNGTIWIMYGNDTSSTDLVIDGSNFTTWSMYSLTLQGGWDGSSSGNIIGSSNFSVPLSIINWNNDVVVSQINIDGTDSTGLEIDTDGDITLEDVSSSNNDGYGAELYASGNITLNGTNQFNNNDQSGVLIDAGNIITTNNITASGNGEYGAEIYTLGNATLNGVNTFSDNGDSGLVVDASGNIYAENLTANGNGTAGGYSAGAELYSFGQVNIAGTNLFTNNSDGIYIDADGNIYIHNTDAANNDISGIYVASSANAEITCGTLSDNASYEIESALNGTLTLNGVNFGVDIEGELGVDQDQLVLNSNGCYTYPSDQKQNSNGGNTVPSLPSTTSSSIHIIDRAEGQTTNLDCEIYQGTLLILSNGDGAYIPCPIIDSANISGLQEKNLPYVISQDYGFVSSFAFTILKNGEDLGPLYIPNSIWVEAEQGFGVQVTYWNGTEWINASDRITPFMNVFFKIPDNMKGAELAILYWDGKEWIEIVDAGHLGHGYIVKTGGHVSEDGIHFEATLNFTGIFVLVQK